MKSFQPGLALILTGCLLILGAQGGFAYQNDGSGSQPPPSVQQRPEQLQQLVAPIALYPDALIAQILAAATYPDQIVDAGRWMEPRWRFFPVGTRIRDCTWMARESGLDWDSALDSLAASDGAGMVGDLIGTTEAESSTTTTLISRIAERSSITITFGRMGGTQ